MQQNEKSNGSLRERWAECWAERLAGRIAGAASAEEMRMWPLMLRTLALNLRAGIPLQEAAHTDRALGSSGSLGSSRRTSWCRVRGNRVRRKQPPGKAPALDGHEASRPFPKTTGTSGAPKISAASCRLSPRLPPGVPPRTSPAPSCSKIAPGCARTAASACTTCS